MTQADLDHIRKVWADDEGKQGLAEQAEYSIDGLLFTLTRAFAPE